MLWWTICRRMMELQWNINGRCTLWMSLIMTFRELTELQEKSQNAAHVSAINHQETMNGWNPLDRNYKWMDDWIWMDDSRSISGDRSRERMKIYLLSYMKILRLSEVLPCSKSLTLFSTYPVTIRCRYVDTWWTADGAVPASTLLTTIQSTIPRYRSMQFMPEFAWQTQSGMRFHVTATMLIPQISKPYQISRLRSNDQ